MDDVIIVKNLVKRYADLTAVSDISFEVHKGEIFGLLGENGAGKTTTLEIIEGLRRPTGGDISVLGHSGWRELHEIKQKIGVQLQSSAYFNFLTLKEILDLFTTFAAAAHDATCGFRAGVTFSGPFKYHDCCGLDNCFVSYRGI